MWLLPICDEVATLALRAPRSSTPAIAHTHPLQSAANCYSKVHRRFRDKYSYFKSCKSATPTAMAQSKSLSSDPEELLQFMDNLDSDFSDDDFEGYIDEDEWLEETMRRRISVQQKDGSRNSVVSVHSSRLDGDVNDWTEGSENGDGMEGSENCDGMEGSENGDGTDGSKNDRMDSDVENSDSDDHANTNTNGIPVFAENVGVIPDMTGKEPVDYYRLFITDSWPFCTPLFSKLLSCDRFFLFLKFLHLADNTKQAARGEPGHDKLFKLRPFMDPLIQSFQQMFIPQQQLSID